MYEAGIVILGRDGVYIGIGDGGVDGDRSGRWMEPYDGAQKHQEDQQGSRYKSFGVP